MKPSAARAQLSLSPPSPSYNTMPPARNSGQPKSPARVSKSSKLFGGLGAEDNPITLSSDEESVRHIPII